MTSSSAQPAPAPPRVVLFDPLATVPYYTAYLSRALLQQGVKVTIRSISYYLDPACFSSRGLRLQPGFLNIVGRFPLPGAPRRVLKLFEFALNLAALSIRSVLSPPEVLHIQFLPLLRWRLPLDLLFVQFSQRRGSKLVLTVHDLLPHDTADRFHVLFQKLYRGMDALICHSDHVKHRLETEFGIATDRIFVIPHGPFFYDLPPADTSTLRSSLGIDSAHPIVLWQGIIFPYKGLDLLLEAWQRVEEQNSQAHLVVAGTGAPAFLAAIREHVERLGLQRVSLNLRFISSEELVALYRDAEIVVYPYRAITTSGALATGLALGKAIVASDLPVFRELLIDGQNASLVPVGNPEALAAAIVSLLADPRQRQKLVHNVAAMNFGPASWSAIAQATSAVYRSVLSPATPGTVTPPV